MIWKKYTAHGKTNNTTPNFFSFSRWHTYIIYIIVLVMFVALLLSSSSLSNVNFQPISYIHNALLQNCLPCIFLFDRKVHQRSILLYFFSTLLLYNNTIIYFVFFFKFCTKMIFFLSFFLSPLLIFCFVLLLYSVMLL